MESTQYFIDSPFGGQVKDKFAIRDRLAEIGLNHEAFSLSSDQSGAVALTFWEPDRIEALRILAKLKATA